MDARANIEIIRSCQFKDVSTNVDTMDVTLRILQPKASEIYYGACSKKGGDMYGLVKRNTSPHGCDLLAYVWID